jgi:hypothetical protein
MRTGFRTTSYGGSSFLNKISLQSDDLKKWRGILTVPKFKRVNVVSTMFPDKGKKNITYELECESRN